MVKIFVGRLPEDVKKSELEDLFKEYGEVTDSCVLKNYGFVHMANEEEAKAAINGLDKHTLNGNTINVELSTTKVAKTCKIFVGNLPEDTKSADIHKMFKKYGTVIECDVVKNYAFVHMSKESMAKDAIEALNGTMVGEKKIAVQMARQRPTEGPPMYGDPFRGRGRGRGVGMGPMRGMPPMARFPRRPYYEDPTFMDPAFARMARPTLRPRLHPGMPERNAGLGGLYDHDLLGRASLARRDPLVTTGDYLLSREREALAQRLDADLYRDSYRTLGAASAATARYDYAGYY